MTLRAVILDLDDTIIVEEAHARSSLRRAATLIPGVNPHEAEGKILVAIRAEWRRGPYHQLALELGIASWEGLWSRFEGCHPRLDGLAAWAESYRQQAWQSVVQALGSGDLELATAMGEAYDAAQRAGHPLIEGAAQAVERLADRFRLALLTNGPADIQRLKLDRTGLSECFDVVAISGATGVGKPAQTAFRSVVDALGVSPAEVVMVGDSWERDMAGAAALGVDGVWISEASSPPEGGTAVVVPSLVEAVPVLEARTGEFSR